MRRNTLMEKIGIATTVVAALAVLGAVVLSIPSASNIRRYLSSRRM